MALGKLTIVLGAASQEFGFGDRIECDLGYFPLTSFFCRVFARRAGLIGSMLTKDANLSDITHLFSGAFRIFTKHLQQDKDNPRSTSKPQTDSLLAQVNTLREELQLLASSRSVTIVTGDGSGSRRNGVTAIIVVGALGYVFIWWKGWKLSDMMFVTRRGLSDACTRVGKQLELLSSSIAAAKRQLSSRMDRVDSNLEECKELAGATKCEVSQLHGDLSLFHTEVESVHRAVQTLETKLGRIEGSQDFATRGVYHLCQFVDRLEQGRNQEFLQASNLDSPTTSQRAIELPQTSSVVGRTSSLPPLAVESPSPSSASPSIALESPRILRSSTAVSASGLKELQEISNAIKPGSMKSNMMSGNTSEVSNRTTEEPNGTAPSSSRSILKSTEEQNGAAPSSSRSIWKLPSISILSRTRSSAT
ncbi:hypothetical protein MUK42_00372 [Musa troglodytarum]|uniref:DUF1664 domain-containing protein n=1 Tax=Musa troglodytarum TaxID=320322 RepID=A0A9E7FEK0_9LILI|nr:hypothetical protein MUK42_00372 [Musa troglodytarum]